MKAQLERLVEVSLQASLQWLQKSPNGGSRIVDPIDRAPVPSHYGDSHFAAATMLLGSMRSDSGLVKKALSVAEAVLDEWRLSSKANDFHHDFNNFALCLIEEKVRPIRPVLSGRIRRTVLSTPDSKHNTINWLPMRAYVNLARQEWTGEVKYRVAATRALDIVAAATNEDGGIEDRLPHGSSYNLQYNVSSHAALDLLKRRWPEAGLELDLVRSRAYLLEHVLPDGDINYVGRGVNQIFAWGPWLYSLAASGEEEALGKALEFLVDRYAEAAECKNVLMNGATGRERLFWWDYHHCSVYHAHFLLWSTLALQALDLRSEKAPRAPRTSEATGLKLEHYSLGGAALFAGRSTYLAEAGPGICAVWLSNKGMLFKGGLGPWVGPFGRKHSYADTVFQNHFGLIAQSAPLPSPVLDGRIARLLMPNIPRDRAARICPEFAAVEISEIDGALCFTWDTVGHEGYCNIPIAADLVDAVEVEFRVDGERLENRKIGTFINQYGWHTLVRSRPVQGQRWQVLLR